ncbi:uncharacterized protein LOC144863817 [Branchiostoma floridae x Branchiostoma japonicum]
MAAAGGGDDPRRPPGHAHEYGPYKKLLLGIFEDMDNAEYKSFKHHLDCVVSSDHVSIPKYRVQRAKRQDMPDLILCYIQRREALEVVARILRDLPNVQLLERIRQFTHPEPGTVGYMVMQIKHAAESEEDYQRNCEDLVAFLNGCSPGLGNLILEEVRRRECVLVKYLLYTKEPVWKRTRGIIEIMSTEEYKEDLRHLGVIYIKVDNATLFTGELHMDPRTWDPVEVTQWVARTLLPSDPTATIPDLQMTGAEICTKAERWFTDKFPARQGWVLYSNLQQRRNDTAYQWRFGGREEEKERVVESTSATFLTSAYLISMILTLLGVRQHRERAEHILQYLQSLIEVTKRRSQSEKPIRSGHFNHSWAEQNVIKEIRSLPSTEASVVFGSRAIAISSEAYSQVVSSVVEAMEIIGAPLEIKSNDPLWEWRRANRLDEAVLVAAQVVGGTAAALAVGAATVVNAAAALPLVPVLAAFAGFAAVRMYRTMFLHESEKKNANFKANYSQALILLLEVLGERDMTKQNLQELIARAQAVSKSCSIRDVESHMIEILPSVSKLGPRIPPSRIQEEAHFDYRAKIWLADDSIRNINDTMTIAYAQYQLRHLLRDVFVLGVIGSKHSGKNTMLESVFPEGERRAHKTRRGPHDVKLFDGSNDLDKSSLPVLHFPSGQGKEVDAAHKLCTGVCGAFICMVENVEGTRFPDIGALARVEGLHVPVLLCVNKCGGVKYQREATQILDRYEYQVSRDYGSLRNLTEVVLTDFQTTDLPAWLTGAEGVKYWIRDAIQNHKRYARQ